MQTKSSLKFGRKPAVHDLRSMLSAVAMARHLDPLGPPPPVCNNYVDAVEKIVGGTDAWLMLGNGPDPSNPAGIPDGCGDCTDADTGHTRMLRTANTGQIVIPTTDQVLQLYTARTGFDPATGANDNGDEETGLCRYLVDTGWLGERADNTAMIDPGNLNHLKWGVQIFGHVRLGFNVPQSFMDQFNAGQPIRDVRDHRIIGGHDVPIVHYDNRYFYIVTWGKRVPVLPNFFNHGAGYLEEAHIELWPDWLRSQGTAPNNLNIAQLDQDLTEISFAT
jgi:hypothetical protein